MQGVAGRRVGWAARYAPHVMSIVRVLLWRSDSAVHIFRQNLRNAPVPERVCVAVIGQCGPGVRHCGQVVVSTSCFDRTEPGK
jgi:hypothetical protein